MFSKLFPPPIHFSYLRLLKSFRFAQRSLAAAGATAQHGGSGSGNEAIVAAAAAASGTEPLGETPIKPLPFSPSQFLHSPAMSASFDVLLPASTPVRKHFQKVCVRCVRALLAVIYDRLFFGSSSLCGFSCLCFAIAPQLVRIRIHNRGFSLLFSF